MHCVKTVTEALSEVPDVTNVREVSLEKGTAGFEGSPAPSSWWRRWRSPAIGPKRAADVRGLGSWARVVEVQK